MCVRVHWAPDSILAMRCRTASNLDGALAAGTAGGGTAARTHAHAQRHNGFKRARTQK